MSCLSNLNNYDLLCSQFLTNSIDNASVRYYMTKDPQARSILLLLIKVMVCKVFVSIIFIVGGCQLVLDFNWTVILYMSHP